MDTPNPYPVVIYRLKKYLTYQPILILSILIHNHPSGDPTPSRAGIEMTKTIMEVGQPIGVTEHNHVIVGRDGHASLRGLKLI